MDIAERIKLIRGEDRQEDFADKLGVKKNTVGRWERGEQVPDYENLINILQVYQKIRATWLLTGEGPMIDFTSSSSPGQSATDWYPENKGELVVNEENLSKIGKILEEKLGERRYEVNADQMLSLMMTLYRFYSRNFVESEEFRQDTMEKNIESLVRLVLD